MFESLNFQIEIKDLTLGNKVPVIGILFTNNNVKNANKLIKSVHYKTLMVDSHFDLEEAIIRCFTENIQIFGANKENLVNPGQLVFPSYNHIYRIDVINKYFRERSQLFFLIIFSFFNKIINF